MPAMFESGFSVRERMWHGLGLVLDDYPTTWAEARKLAGLEWEPVEEPAYEVVNFYGDGRADVKVIDGFKQIKRSDTGGRLTIAQDSYHLVNHTVMGELFEAVMDAFAGPEGLQYETAGSVQEGRKVWALARVGAPVELPGDPSPMQPYIALLNSHDGNTAVRLINTNVRIVCWNTFHMADMQASKEGRAYSFRHTSGVMDRVKEAQVAMTLTRKQIDATIEQAKEMLRAKISREQREKFVEEFAILRVVQNSVGRRKITKADLVARLEQPRVKKTLDSVRADLTGILDSRTCEGIRDTAWGLVQAGIEATDHFRDADSDETRFSRAMLVDREPIKVDTIKLAQQIVKA